MEDDRSLITVVFFWSFTLPSPSADTVTMATTLSSLFLYLFLEGQ
jgi:hypothetical protein